MKNETINPIGIDLSPILEELENALWEHESTLATKPDYTMEGFRAATKIFMSVVMDKLWELQESEKITQHDRELMAESAGKDLRKFVLIYCDIDTFSLYSMERKTHLGG